eukprot:6457421-Amphidinium_carterae.1
MTELLRPSTLFLRWRGDCKGVIHMVEGTPQGGPMSPWFFLVGLDPLLRQLASRLRPEDLLSAWADDLAAVTVSFRSLLLVYNDITCYTLVSGLALQLQKCVLIPLGASSLLEWTAELYNLLPADHGIRAIPIQLTARYLGILVGRGEDLDLSLGAHEKLLARAVLVSDLGLGSPQGLHLYQIVGTSCVRHALSCCMPSSSLRTLWHTIFAKHFPAASALGDSRFWAREAHSWPADVPHLDVQWLQTTLSVLPHLSVNPIAIHQDLVTRAERVPSLVYPLAG